MLTPEEVNDPGLSDHELGAIIYGVCPECGAPRQRMTVDETHPSGKQTLTWHLICSAEPIKHPQ